MKQFTTEELQARFEQLPPEVQQAVTSTDVQERIKAISQKHGLHVDQFGTLVEEIGLVMLGLQRSSMFVPDLVANLSISQQEAKSISADVNAEIFSAIRQHLQEADAKAEQEELHETTVPHIEQAGNMEILSDEIKPESAKTEPMKPAISAKPYTEPLIDRLLSQPSSATAQTVQTVISNPVPVSTQAHNATTKPATEQQTPSKLPPLKPRIDPYRETV